MRPDRSQVRDMTDMVLAATNSGGDRAGFTPTMVHALRVLRAFVPAVMTAEGPRRGHLRAAIRAQMPIAGLQRRRRLMSPRQRG
jgi:hypothetical protein